MQLIPAPALLRCFQIVYFIKKKKKEKVLGDVGDDIISWICHKFFMVKTKEAPHCRDEKVKYSGADCIFPPPKHVGELSSGVKI